MEQLIVLLIGVGAIVLSPLYIKQLRPVAKTAIKGGLSLKEAASGLATSTGEPAAEEIVAVAAVTASTASSSEAAPEATEPAPEPAESSDTDKPKSKSKSKSTSKSKSAPKTTKSSSKSKKS